MIRDPKDENFAKFFYYIYETFFKKIYFFKNKVTYGKNQIISKSLLKLFTILSDLCGAISIPEERTSFP